MLKKKLLSLLIGMLVIVFQTAYASTPEKKQVSSSVSPERVKQLYNNYCFVCHQAGGAGSPKLGDALAWDPRIKSGQPSLLKHTLEGMNFMPAKGTCQECTTTELVAIIDYMLSQCPKCEKLPKEIPPTKKSNASNVR